MARNLVSRTFIALLCLGAAPTAHAMYSPTLGCFINRDPGLEPTPGSSDTRPVLPQRYSPDVVHPMSIGHIAPRPYGGRGYHDGMNLYSSYFVPNGLDPSGLGWILCVYTSAAEGQKDPSRGDDPILTAGHAALLILDEESHQTTSYGLWPDGYDGIATPSSDVRVNYQGDSGSRYQYVFCICITDAQKSKFDAEVNRKWKWGHFNNCASFASEVFETTTGIEVDADDIMGIETPRELGEHILELNNNPPKSQCCDEKSSK